MIDNRETNPELILTQTRLRRNQATLNIELALSTKTSITSSQGGASAGGSTSVGGGILGDGGGIGGGGGGGGGEDPGRFCFSAETIVTMFEHASRFISAIQCGFEVEAPDEDGKVQRGTVVGLTQRMYSSFLQVTFEGGRYTEVRPEHRYRSEGGIYVPISEADHSLHRLSTTWIRSNIVEKKLIELDRPKIFYNLEVEGYHAYMANEDWVSNVKILE